MEESRLRECVEHKNWRWTPGMKAVGRLRLPEAWFRLEEGVRRLHGEWSRALPDLEDPATVGALLGLARSLHSDPFRLWDGHVEVHRDHRKIFIVVQPYHDEEGALCYHVLASGETEAEALIQTIIREKDCLRSVEVPPEAEVV